MSIAVMFVTISAFAQENLRGSFVQERFLRGFEAPLRSEGSFILSPGLGLVWRTELPFQTATVIGRRGLLQKIGARDAMLIPIERAPFIGEIHSLLDAALRGDWGSLSSRGTMISRRGDAQAWEVEVTLISGAAVIPGVRRIIARGGRFVDKIEMFKTDGDRDRIRFSGQTLSTEALGAPDAELLALVSEK